MIGHVNQTYQTHLNRENTMHYKLYLFLMIVITGCSDYKESFSTDAGTGSGWKSMSKTYEFNNEQKEKVEKSTLLPVQEREDVLLRRVDRQPEETIKIWYAPFQDEDNNLYDASFVKTIVKKGEWLSLKNKGDVK